MSFPVSKNKAAFIESLIGSKCHFEVVPDSHQKNASFGEIYGGLADNLIKKLVMNFLSDGADSTFSGLLFNQFRFKSAFKFLQLLPAGFPLADVESVVFAISFEDVGLEHFIEDIGVFGIEIGGLDGVEDGGLLVNLFIFDEFLSLDFDPVGVKDKEALFDGCSGHNYYETNTEIGYIMI